MIDQLIKFLEARAVIAVDEINRVPDPEETEHQRAARTNLAVGALDEIIRVLREIKVDEERISDIIYEAYQAFRYR